MLGDRDLNIELPANSTPALRDATLRAAATAGLSRCVTRNDAVLIKDDHSAFYDAGYPAIDLIDFDYGSARGKNDYWHTSADSLDKISATSLHAAGRLVVALLGELSAAGDCAKLSAFRNESEGDNGKR